VNRVNDVSILTRIYVNERPVRQWWMCHVRRARAMAHADLHNYTIINIGRLKNATASAACARPRDLRGETQYPPILAI
jgi:hypothetical protein